MEKLSKWSFGDWFLALIGTGIALVLLMLFAEKVGLIDPIPTQNVAYVERPVFDNKECLQRNQYRVRENDPLISDDALFGQVARACVVEKNEFYGR